MNKVISYCLWGKDPKYLVGMRRNIEQAAEIYPGWMVSICFGNDIPRRTRFELMHGHEDICRSTILPKADWTLMLDRFRVIAWDDVDVMISRDADSRLSLREKVAVDEWLKSDKHFHAIHDHYHHTVPILGGLWGMKSGAIDDIGSLVDQWLNRPLRARGDYWQVDQEFLTQIIWPTASHSIMNHTEFHGDTWPGIPIPMRRIGREFIGATYDVNDKIDASQQRCLYG